MTDAITRAHQAHQRRTQPPHPRRTIHLPRHSTADLGRELLLEHGLTPRSARERPGGGLENAGSGGAGLGRVHWCEVPSARAGRRSRGVRVVARIVVLLSLAVGLATGPVGLAALTGPGRPDAFAAGPLATGGVGVGIQVLGPSPTATANPSPSSPPPPPPTPTPSSAPPPPPPPSGPPPSSAPAPSSSPAAPPLVPPAPPVAGGGGLAVTGIDGRWLLAEIMAGVGAVFLGGILVRLTARRRRG